MRLTPRRLAVLASAAERDGNVKLLANANNRVGYRYSARGVKGDCTPQAEFLLTNKLLTRGPRGASFFAPVPLLLTDLGREALAANQAAPAPTTRDQLVAAVRTHAVANYDKGGWDVIVECWDDEQIAEQIGRARTLKGALAKFDTLIDVWSDRQAEADYQTREAIGEPETRQELPYDRYADGRHPDGSLVVWRHHAESGDSWALRTWDDKVCTASIDWMDTEDGSEIVEVYHPSWHGVTIRSENYCNHNQELADATGACWTYECRRPGCIPF